MKTRSIATFASVAALLTLGLSAAAQAQDVYWSAGVSSPGVRLGVSNAVPVVVYPSYRPIYQPVYRLPYPVHLAPRSVNYAPPPPVLLAPPRYIRADWRYPGHRHGWQYERHEMEHAGHGGRD